MTLEDSNAVMYWQEDFWLSISLSQTGPISLLSFQYFLSRPTTTTAKFRPKKRPVVGHLRSHEPQEAASLCRDTLTLRTHHKGGGHVSGGECPSEATSFGTRSHPPSLLLQPSSPSALSVSLSGGCLCPCGVWEWFGVFDRLNLAYWCKLHSIHNRHRDTLSVWL